MKLEKALLGVIFTTLGLPAVVVAQETAEGFGLEEIVITARRREESLQEAPLAVTGFGAQAIEDADIERMEDFIQLTPNVTLATSQGIGTSFLTIRGQGQTRNGESPAAVIIDGVLQIDSRQFRQELFDVESIQVVKGPQGAIFGRNATAGAIIIDTKAPSDQAEGFIRAGFGEGDEYSLGASMSGPLTDNLGASVSVNYIDRDGYLDNITTGEKDDPFQDTTIRTRLVWEPSDDFSADFKANVSSHNGRAIGFQYQQVNIADDGITGDGFDFAGGADTGPVDADNVVAIRSNNVDEGDRDSHDLSLRMDWGASFGSFTSTTAYTSFEEFGGTDQFPYTAAMSSPAVFGFDGTQTQYVDVDGWSQEFRITSSDDQRLRWNAGVYYLSFDRFISSTTGTDTGEGVIRLEREPTTDPANPTLSFFADDNENTAWAVFGQLNYDASDALELSLALRYDEEERDQRVSDLQLGAGEPGAENSATFDAWQPKFTARYTPSDESTLYFTWGVGFRSGQFNQNGVAEAAAGAGVNGVSDLYGQEDTESLEVGYKGLLADGRLRVNAALFDTTIENAPYFVFIGSIGAQVLVGIDEISVQGGEIDLTYRASENFDVYAAYGYTDSEIEEYAVNTAAVGNEAPYVPGSTFNIGAQFTSDISEGLGLLARADYEIRGAQYWDPENTTDRSDLSLLNLKLGIESADNVWSLTATVENATDEEYNSEWVAGGFSAAAPGRIWGVDYRYNF